MTFSAATIRDAAAAILSAANTTTASPVDLSASLNRRIVRVFRLNPEQIPMHAQFMPYVAVYPVSKAVRNVTMGQRSTSGAVRADPFTLEVVGAVYEPLITDVEQDFAQDNLLSLMENVERILRSNITLTSTVDWSTVTRIDYVSVPGPRGEQTILRAGILTLETQKFY